MNKAILFLLLTCRLLASDTPAYDPLTTPDATIVSKTFEVKDQSRGRTIPVRVYLPPSTQPEPVVLFSHGLGGSADNNPYLGIHWAKRGYVVVFMQHPGSDESVWKNAPSGEKFIAMKQAANTANFLDRAMDVPKVIDALTTWNADPNHTLHQRLDLEHIGMSGHSFGAITTQAVAGQSFIGGRTSFREPRIDAAVMMSPGPPAAGDLAKAFSTISIPCLLMTGTRDDSPIGNQKAADRLKVFPNLQHAPAWQVVFDQATHMTFGERGSLRGATQDPRYHRAILALTTAFWDVELRNNSKAKTWLNGEGAKSMLAPEDDWKINRSAGN